MHQKLSGVDFDERLFETIGVAVFEQPVELRFFQRIVGMSCKPVFWAKVAQGCLR